VTGTTYSTWISLTWFRWNSHEYTPGTRYFQTRPNVIFELGWFYGRLGPENVCLLFEKRTAIPSCLDGIMRIEFDESIEEKVMTFRQS
jgi:predicted nucleotide-binding protein